MEEFTSKDIWDASITKTDTGFGAKAEVEWSPSYPGQHVADFYLEAYDDWGGESGSTYKERKAHGTAILRYRIPGGKLGFGVATLSPLIVVDGIGWTNGVDIPPETHLVSRIAVSAQARLIQEGTWGGPSSGVQTLIEYGFKDPKLSPISIYNPITYSGVAVPASSIVTPGTNATLELQIDAEAWSTGPWSAAKLQTTVRVEKVVLNVKPIALPMVWGHVLSPWGLAEIDRSAAHPHR